MKPMIAQRILSKIKIYLQNLDNDGIIINILDITSGFAD